MDRTQFILGLVLLIGLVFIRLWDPYPIQAGRNFYFDSLQQIKPRPYQDVGVRVVESVVTRVGPMAVAKRRRC